MENKEHFTWPAICVDQTYIEYCNEMKSLVLHDLQPVHDWIWFNNIPCKTMNSVRDPKYRIFFFERASYITMMKMKFPKLRYTELDERQRALVEIKMPNCNV